MQIEKIDNNQIKVKDQVKTIEIIFTYEYLIKQKEAIQKQKDDFIIARDAELSEINELISQCEILGVHAKLIN